MDDNDTLHSEKIDVERKCFYFDLKQNDRGAFLRITEDVRGRRDTIIVPSSGLEDFRNVLDAIIESAKNSGVETTLPPDEGRE